LREAEQVGDAQLKAQALAGRAEIRIAQGQTDLAVREVERALAAHRALKDPVRETEDLRILAVALGAAGRYEEAARMLREVIEHATQHKRPLLVATAQRDLAQLMAGAGEFRAANEEARAARAGFDRLGAKGEIAKLDALLEQNRRRGNQIPLNFPTSSNPRTEVTP
jgi:ATP/maltotriose-dependent transcriptional regulator MalT